MKRRFAIPTYVWTFLVLLLGIIAGGAAPELLRPVSTFTSTLIQWVIAVVPLLILAALSPAISTLVQRGLAGRFAGGVVLWYVGTSIAAGAFGCIVGALIFDLPFAQEQGARNEAATLFGNMGGGGGGASLPFLAIVASVFLGVLGAWIRPIGGFLDRVGAAIGGAGNRIGYVMMPIVGLLGITIGVSFGAFTGLQHYFTMTAYTAALCLTWSAAYLFLGVGRLGRRKPREILTNYYLPTALFAAATCSSLATLPVNLNAARSVGVRKEVADFVIPFGSIFNLDASAIAYLAYAPFVLNYIMGIDVSWTLILTALPPVVLFTIAAPGLPAGIGTALWSATLYASMLGLEDPARTEFIGTWLALSAGLPDMFRTSTNTTSDGFTAIIFDRFFDRLTGRTTTASPGTATPIEQPVAKGTA